MVTFILVSLGIGLIVIFGVFYAEVSDAMRDGVITKSMGALIFSAATVLVSIPFFSIVEYLFQGGA